MDLFYCKTKDDVNFCLHQGDNIEFTLDEESALSYHCKEGNIVVVCALIEQGANVNYESRNLAHYLHTPFIIACKYGHSKLVKAMLHYDSIKNNINKCSGGYNPLTYACYEGHCDIFDILLDAGADINFPNVLGRTSLMEACIGNQIYMIDKLLSYGADVNHYDEDGLTAAFYASTPEIFNRLYSYGLDLSMVDYYGNTPLINYIEYMGIQFGYLEIIELMLNYCNNVNVAGCVGRTPLIKAILRRRSVDLIKLLLQYGADVNICDNVGKTALDYAKDASSTIYNLLQPCV